MAQETAAFESFIVEAPPVVYWNCNVYSLDFSPDGQLLAIGCGGWYGEGGIALVDLTTRARASCLRFVTEAFQRDYGFEAGETRILPGETNGVPSDIPGSLTISGVMFDASGEYIAASSWRSRHNEGPAFLFRVRPDNSMPLALEVSQAFPVDLESRRRFISRTTNGIFISNHGLIARALVHDANDSRSVFKVHSLQTTLTAPAHSYQSHSRFAVVDNEFVTGFMDGLVSLDCQTGVHSCYGVRTGNDDSSRSAVSAITTLPGREAEILTGHDDGTIQIWKRTPYMTWIRLQEVYSPTRRDDGHNIVALCALDDGRFFSATASGEILEWQYHQNSCSDTALSARILKPRSLSRDGTVRSLAVHPSTPSQNGRRVGLLAVGVKSTDRSRRGFVECFEIEMGWHIFGHFILLRELVRQGRAIAAKTDGTHDGRTMEALATRVLCHLMSPDFDDDLFRKILSFL